jgi:hypothetical protein
MLAIIDASLPAGNGGVAVATFIISYRTYRTDGVVVKTAALPRASGRRPVGMSAQVDGGAFDGRAQFVL